MSTTSIVRHGATGLPNLSSWERALECTRSALDKKAYDLVVLDTAKHTSIADYFVICSGRSDTQVQAIAEAIEADRRAHGERPVSVEGLPRGQWVLMDYGDVVVHVFLDEIRRFYEIERLYRDAPTVDWGA